MSGANFLQDIVSDGSKSSKFNSMWEIRFGYETIIGIFWRKVHGRNIRQITIHGSSYKWQTSAGKLQEHQRMV